MRRPRAARILNVRQTHEQRTQTTKDMHDRTRAQAGDRLPEGFIEIVACFRGRVQEAVYEVRRQRRSQDCTENTARDFPERITVS